MTLRGQAGDGGTSNPTAAAASAYEEGSGAKARTCSARVLAALSARRTLLPTASSASTRAASTSRNAASPSSGSGSPRPEIRRPETTSQQPPTSDSTASATHVTVKVPSVVGATYMSTSQLTSGCTSPA